MSFIATKFILIIFGATYSVRLMGMGILTKLFFFRNYESLN
ncbi:hypothetical protein EMIT079MI2_170001 [Bacillus sp. IT-79MI2]